MKYDKNKSVHEYLAKCIIMRWYVRQCASVPEIKAMIFVYDLYNLNNQISYMLVVFLIQLK